MDQSPVGYIPCEQFALSVTRFTNPPFTEELRIKTVEQLDEHLCRVESEAMLAIGLTALDPTEADWGSFWLLVNGDRALVHLIEGPCLSARDPGLEGRTDAVLVFLDDAGNEITVSVEQTLAREQGLRALRHWMPDGEKLQEFRWVRA